MLQKPQKPVLMSSFMQFSEIKPVKKGSENLVAVFNITNPDVPFIGPDRRNTDKRIHIKTSLLDYEIKFARDMGFYEPDELEKAKEAMLGYN